MIAVAVLGILASIAIPSYGGYVNRSKRAAAKAVLLDAANLLERSCPSGSEAFVDADCGTLSLTQAGARSISGSGTVATCWQRLTDRASGYA